MSQLITANDVLIDLLGDNRRRLYRVMDEISDACLHWSHDPGANSIAVTIWHMGRLFDVFLTQYAEGSPAEDECWFSKGWAERTGYDPRGIGRDGWGSVNGYTAEEVAAVPRFSREQLLGYFDDVHSSVRTYLSGVHFAELQSPASGFDGRFTRYQCIQMALLDNVRHLGEILALKGIWERRAAAEAAL